MSFEQRFQEIVCRYGFEAEDLVDSKLINSMIVDLFSRRCGGKKIAIWGVGKKNAVNGHCAVIISKYILNLTGLTYLIDSDIDLQHAGFMGYPVIAPEEAAEKGIDIIIIASKGSRFSIRRRIEELIPGCEYIDIYEELEKDGIKIDYNFFSEQNVYTELYRVRSLMERENEDEKKINYLKKLISYYLKIKDFYYTDYYSNIYCTRRYPHWKKVRDMVDEIKKLQAEVKAANANRKGDVIVHLIDSLRAMDVYGTNENGDFKLNIFQDYEKNTAIFTQAYSTGPTTYESMIGTIKQKLSFQENVYENNHFIFHIDEFEFLKKIYEKGMPIKFYNSKDYLVMNPCKEIQMKEQLHMPEKLWTLACDMAESSEPAFSFVYYPWELHFPMLCGFMKNEPQIRQFADVGVIDMSGFIEQQLADCLAYVDLQFSYYKDFFSEDTLTVIMADHSQPVFDKNRNDPFFMYYSDKDRVSHIAFLIHGNGIEANIYDGLISMLDFNKIMLEAVFHNQIIVPERKAVQYQFYNIQNRGLREVAKSRNLMDYTEGIHCFLSKKYLYVKTATGKREIYLVEGQAAEQIKLEEGNDFIQFVEDNFDTGFPDFWTIRSDV